MSIKSWEWTKKFNYLLKVILNLILVGYYNSSARLIRSILNPTTPINVSCRFRIHRCSKKTPFCHARRPTWHPPNRTHGWSMWAQKPLQPLTCQLPNGARAPQLSTGCSSLEYRQHWLSYGSEIRQTLLNWILSIYFYYHTSPFLLLSFPLTLLTDIIFYNIISWSRILKHPNLHGRWAPLPSHSPLLRFDPRVAVKRSPHPKKEIPPTYRNVGPSILRPFGQPRTAVHTWTRHPRTLPWHPSPHPTRPIKRNGRNHRDHHDPCFGWDQQGHVWARDAFFGAGPTLYQVWWAPGADSRDVDGLTKAGPFPLPLSLMCGPGGSQGFFFLKKKGPLHHTNKKKIFPEPSRGSQRFF